MNLLNKHRWIILLLVLAGFLRIYKITEVPPSLDWDEASLGYNAYSILKTGSDEYGNYLPFSIRSFNDYKPPAYVYLAIPSIAMFGLTEFAVRLPSAIMGVIAVASIYWLVLELFTHHKHKQKLALLTALFLAINPWHLQFSRAAFEANFAVGFYLIFLASYLHWLNAKKKSIAYLILSVLSAVGCLYSYHSARVVIPAMLLGLAIYNKSTLLKNRTHVLIAITLGVILLFPLAVISTRGDASERFSATSIFTNPGEFSRERERLERIKKFKDQHTFPFDQFHKRSTVYVKLITRNYFEHFNFDFLFLKGDGNLRHHTTGMGQLYLASLPFIILGAHKLARSKDNHKRIVWYVLLFGPLPASLTASTPHAIRSIMMLPAFPILTAYGLVSLLKSYSFSRHIIQYTLVFLLFSANIFYYLNLYYTYYPQTSSQDWQYGYKQLVSKVSEVEGKYETIIITTKYDQPHIFFAFYNQINPTQYQTYAETAGQGFDRYIFKKIDQEDFARQNTLIVAEPERAPSDLEAQTTIPFLDGSIAFNLYELE